MKEGRNKRKWEKIEEFFKKKTFEWKKGKKKKKNFDGKNWK